MWKRPFYGKTAFPQCGKGYIAEKLLSAILKDYSSFS
jgi:hypothetical protein